MRWPVEVDLPENEIEYEVEHIIKKINTIDINDEKFNEKFNNEFEKINSVENKDNPYSIHYIVPEEKDRNLQDSQILLTDSNSIKSNNIHEFGINYVEDYSSDTCYDFKKLDKLNNSMLDKTLPIKIKEEVDLNLNDKLDNLINLRNNKVELSEEDILFIKNQEQIKKNIQESKNNIQHKRNIELLN